MYRIKKKETWIKDKKKQDENYLQTRKFDESHTPRTFCNALSDLKLLDLAFQVSTTLHAKKLLRARTLQSGLTRAYGWSRVILLVLTAKKISTLRSTRLNIIL